MASNHWLFHLIQTFYLSASQASDLPFVMQLDDGKNCFGILELHAVRAAMFVYFEQEM